MNYKIQITLIAERDLSNALDYIDYVLKNPDAADYLLNETERIFSSLANYPERIPTVDDPILSNWGIRLIQVNNYLAFFQIDTYNNTVHLLRFLYKKCDWITILKQGFSIE